MPGELPSFKYHPDPLSTGSVIESDRLCLSCRRTRGYVYVGPVFAVNELDEELCPWCIADGSAAQRFNAVFTDVGLGVPPDVPRYVTEEVARRTPGFVGWQQEHWLYHCGDAAAFLGRVGFHQLELLPDATEALQREARLLDLTDGQAEAHVRSLHADGDFTAYLFRCLACGIHLAYSDSS